MTAARRRDLKLLANRNLVETGRELFSTLHKFTDIGIDLLKRIHYLLSRDLHGGGGAASAPSIFPTGTV